jgi:hypothetical protein
VPLLKRKKNVSHATWSPASLLNIFCQQAQNILSEHRWIFNSLPMLRLALKWSISSFPKDKMCHYVTQLGLELLSSNDPPVSSHWIAGTIGEHHPAWLIPYM